MKWGVGAETRIRFAFLPVRLYGGEWLWLERYATYRSWTGLVIRKAYMEAEDEHLH